MYKDYNVYIIASGNYNEKTSLRTEYIFTGFTAIKLIIFKELLLSDVTKLHICQLS